jgi:hypothetical protein
MGRFITRVWVTNGALRSDYMDSLILTLEIFEAALLLLFVGSLVWLSFTEI